MLATAVVFVVFYSLIWLTWTLFVQLHKVSPFPDNVFELVVRIEKWVIYFDILGCAVMLAVGFLRFCRDLMED